MKFVRYVFVVLGALVLAAPLAAQAQPRGDDIAPGDRPPRGMCRIWIDGVPAGQQPAPTDCATAVRRRPPNARVIFGDDTPTPRGVETPRSLRSRDDAEREARDRQARELRDRQEREVRERQERERRNRQEDQRKQQERERQGKNRRNPPAVIKPPA